MKVVILAGGKGTRISEESKVRPKPMVEIGGRPILWHIMKWYARFGHREFVICCGYKGHMIKKYFVDYHMQQNNVTLGLRDGTVKVGCNNAEAWRVTLVNTGLETLTAGRILRVRDYIGDEAFMLTYGDGVADVDIYELLACHKKQGRTATITATRPAGRFGVLQLEGRDQSVMGFKEKARKDQAWVNMGFMVFEPSIFDYLGDGSSMLEAAPFEGLAARGQMAAYLHEGFWSPMDNIHDRDYLEELWNKGEAPWRVEGQGL